MKLLQTAILAHIVHSQTCRKENDKIRTENDNIKTTAHKVRYRLLAIYNL